jgi:hypothetical protein
MFRISELKADIRPAGRALRTGREPPTQNCSSRRIAAHRRHQVGATNTATAGLAALTAADADDREPTYSRFQNRWPRR